MAFNLRAVVPWGRSFDEYRAMFSLSQGDLRRSILGCGDGPAGFNAVLARRGGRVVSVDPLYALAVESIRLRIDAAFPEVLEQARSHSDEFVWCHVKSVEELGRLRRAAMEEFLGDYQKGKRQGRYVAGSLPALPFMDGAFDLALCSHFLFLYSAHLTAEFHLCSIRELCRVAREVRVFPLLEMGATRSRHLAYVVSQLTTEGYRPNIENVSYEFQRGGNEMLRVGTPSLRV